ncbi:MAG: hypothetical protein U1F71_01445 [Verrucomicrobiaceae bacterium]
MNIRCLSFLVGTAVLCGLSACTNSSVVTLDYVPQPGQMVQGTPDFVAGKFKDKRRMPAQTLGYVRVPIGPAVDTIQTRLPVSDIVRNAFGYGLQARGMLAPEGQERFVLTGDILDLRSQLLVHPYGYARIRVNLMAAGSKQVLFTKIYEGERQSTAYRPGSGSPVPVLRDLTSRALQEAVDRALDDPALRQSMSAGGDARPRYTPGML